MAKSDTKKGKAMPFDDPALIESRRRIAMPGAMEAGLSEEDQEAEDALLLSYNESELAWLMGTNPVRYRRYLEITGQLATDEVPINVDVPYLSQNGAPAAPTDTVSCTMGNWEHEPTSYLYRWYVNEVPLPPTTENSKTFLEIDVGSVITCVVTATNEGGSTDALPSNPVVLADWAPALMAASAKAEHEPEHNGRRTRHRDKDEDE